MRSHKVNRNRYGMNRLNLLLSGALVLTACEVQDTSVTILGIGLAEFDAMKGTCTLQASEDDFNHKLVLDTAASFSLIVPLTVRNSLPEDPYPGAVTPIRMESRWECDSDAYATELGAFVVPTFDPRRPFCLNRRTDTSGGFTGFDFVPLEGPAISGQTVGLSIAKAIPYHLGAAFDEALQIAVLADKCCRTPQSNCDGSDTTPGGECSRLRDVFATLNSGSRSELKVESDAPGQPSGDLQLFRPFAVFDGSYDLSIPNHDHSGLLLGANYLMRFHGIAEYLRQDGDSLTTNETAVEIGVCRNCGTVNSGANNQRNPFSHDPCYYR